MMNIKRLLTGTLAVAMLALPAGTALAQAARQDVMPVSAITEEQRMGHYASFTGKIQEIHEFEGGEGHRLVLVKARDGSIANFLITKDTVFADGAVLKAGENISGYFRANAPMLMIYPPQYSVEIILKGSQALSVDADIYDADLLNQAGSLKLNIGEKTIVQRADGSRYTGSLQNRKLIVYYDISTKSLPAQTTPKKVIVLDDAVLGKDAAVHVNGEAIQGKPYLNEDGVAMLPLEAALGALGSKWMYNARLNVGVVDAQLIVRSGRDDVMRISGRETIALGAEIACKDNVLYAPLSFFRAAMQLDEAVAFGGNVYLGQYE